MVQTLAITLQNYHSMWQIGTPQACFVKMAYYMLIGSIGRSRGCSRESWPRTTPVKNSKFMYIFTIILSLVQGKFRSASVRYCFSLVLDIY
ncbi:hypothetical protein LINGRAHAP2_LOCUS33742 [Linum grandiflorum]